MTAAKKLFDSDQQHRLFSGMRTEDGEDGGPRENEGSPATCSKKLDFGKACSDDVFMSSEKDFEDDPEEMKDSSYEDGSKKKTAMYAGKQGPIKKRQAKYLSKVERSHSTPLQGTRTAKDLRAECDAFKDVASEVAVSIETGESFDLRSVNIKKHVPDTKQFRIFTYKNPRSKRFIKVLKCDHEACDKWFRKWHNFFDHLRIHTNERPYVCDHPGCGFSFTQRANLNKHVEVHGGVKRFQCPDCDKSFYTNFNLKSHRRTHMPKRRGSASSSSTFEDY